MREDSNILTVNAGSSSIKLDVLRAGAANDDNKHHLSAVITGIGQARAVLTTKDGNHEPEQIVLDRSERSNAISTLTSWLREIVDHHEIAAIGHRIVHGGPKHSTPELITVELIEDLKKYINFDPEHLLIALELIGVMRQQFPEIPEVACFDTNFFRDLPKIAQLLSIPRKYQAEGLRRYGFHGLSYTYILGEFRRIAGDAAANGRVIIAHLGSGASLTAVKDGKPIDMTMSFTPASGIIMSSRSGDVDPGIARYLQAEYGMTLEEYNQMVNFESGLLGVSELSADMYTLLQAQATNEYAADAVNLFVYQVKKAIGALATTLGGVDSIIFSGGIGEQSSELRGRILVGLNFLGIELNPDGNQQHAECISSPASAVGIHVIKTNESRVIITQVIETINLSQS